MVLAHLIASCAPSVGARTMSSIVAVESGGAALAIHDNDTSRSYRPRTQDEATALATDLIARGHSVDLGLAQINDANLPALGLSLRAVFAPCTNLRAGATILAEAYGRARDVFGDRQLALRRAIGAYNTGSLTRGDAYIASVVAAAREDAAPETVLPPPQTREHKVKSRQAARKRPPPALSPSDSPIVVPVTVVSDGTSNP